MTFLRICRLLPLYIEGKVLWYTYLIGKRIKWRIMLFRLQRSKSVQRRCMSLQNNIIKQFKDMEHVTTLTTNFMLTPGTNNNVAQGQIGWDAIICLALWTDEGPLCGLSVEFWNGSLCIRQLQGVAGAKLLRGRTDWVECFVRACQDCVKETGLKRLRLYRANQSLAYILKSPFSGREEDLPPDLRSIRERMRRRYDGTAEWMGFTMTPRWGEWTNPDL